MTSNSIEPDLREAENSHVAPSASDPDDAADSDGGSVPNAERMCVVCNKSFGIRSTLLCHLRKAHGINTGQMLRRGVPCNHPDCVDVGAKFNSTGQYRQHLHEQHSVPDILTSVQYAFRNLSEFMEWKSMQEKKDMAQFIAQRGQALRRGCVVYNCNRSGSYASRATGKRQVKEKGSKKCGCNCPACIILKEEGDNFIATYFPTHYGHEKDIRHLSLTQEDKLNIAEELLSGFSTTEIVQKFRSPEVEATERARLLTRKDISNVRAAYKSLANISLAQPNQASKKSTKKATSKSQTKLLIESSNTVIANQTLNQVESVPAGAAAAAAGSVVQFNNLPINHFAYPTLNPPVVPLKNQNISPSFNTYNTQLLSTVHNQPINHLDNLFTPPVVTSINVINNQSSGEQIYQSFNPPVYQSVSRLNNSAFLLSASPNEMVHRTLRGFVNNPQTITPVPPQSAAPLPQYLNHSSINTSLSQTSVGLLGDSTGIIPNLQLLSTLSDLPIYHTDGTLISKHSVQTFSLPVNPSVVVSNTAQDSLNSALNSWSNLKAMNQADMTSQSADGLVVLHPVSDFTSQQSSNLIEIQAPAAVYAQSTNLADTVTFTHSMINTTPALLNYTMVNSSTINLASTGANFTSACKSSVDVQQLNATTEQRKEAKSVTCLVPAEPVKPKHKKKRMMSGFIEKLLRDIGSLIGGIEDEDSVGPTVVAMLTGLKRLLISKRRFQPVRPSSTVFNPLHVPDKVSMPSNVVKVLEESENPVSRVYMVNGGRKSSGGNERNGVNIKSTNLSVSKPSPEENPNKKCCSLARIIKVNTKKSDLNNSVPMEISSKESPKSRRTASKVNSSEPMNSTKIRTRSSVTGADSPRTRSRTARSELTSTKTEERQSFNFKNLAVDSLISSPVMSNAKKSVRKSVMILPKPITTLNNSMLSGVNNSKIANNSMLSDVSSNVAPVPGSDNRVIFTTFKSSVVHAEPSSISVLNPASSLDGSLVINSQTLSTENDSYVINRHASSAVYDTFVGSIN